MRMKLGSNLIITINSSDRLKIIGMIANLTSWCSCFIQKCLKSGDAGYVDFGSAGGHVSCHE